jgi:hypothetical protein
MGVLAPGSAHARLSAQPPSTIAEIYWHKCLASFVFSQKNSLHNRTTVGQGGPKFFLLPQILFFCDLKPHAKIRKPMITPFGIKVSVGEERREKILLIVDT